MSPLELISKVAYDHTHWRDARGNHWFEVMCRAQGPAEYEVVHRVGAAEAETLAASDADWPARALAEVRGLRHHPRSAELADRLRRLQLTPLGDAELGLLAACVGDSRAVAVYQDWLRGQRRAAEADYLENAPMIVGVGEGAGFFDNARWTCLATSSRPPLLERQPGADGPVAWSRRAGVPVGLAVSFPDAMRERPSPEQVLEAIEDEVAMLPVLDGLELGHSHESWRQVVSGLEDAPWLQRLRVMIRRHEELSNWRSPLLGRLTSLDVSSWEVWRGPAPTLSSFVGRLGPSLRSLRIDGWAPDAGGLERLIAQGLRCLHLDGPTAFSATEVAVSDLRLGARATLPPDSTLPTKVVSLSFIGGAQEAPAIVSAGEQLESLDLECQVAEAPSWLDRVPIDTLFDISEAGCAHGALDGVVNVFAQGSAWDGPGVGLGVLERLAPGVRRLALEQVKLDAATWALVQRLTALEVLELIDCELGDVPDLSRLRALSLWVVDGRLGELGDRASSLQARFPELRIVAGYCADVFHGYGFRAGLGKRRLLVW